MAPPRRDTQGREPSALEASGPSLAMFFLGVLTAGGGVALLAKGGAWGPLGIVPLWIGVVWMGNAGGDLISRLWDFVRRQLP